MATVPLLGRERARALAGTFDAARRASGLAAPAAVLLGVAEEASVFAVVGVLFDFLQRRQDAISKDPPRPDYDRAASVRLPRTELNLASDRWEAIGRGYGSGLQGHLEIFVYDQRRAIAYLAGLLLAVERQAGPLIAGDSKHARDRRDEAVWYAKQVRSSLQGVGFGFSVLVEMSEDGRETVDDDDGLFEGFPDDVLADLFRSNVTGSQLDRLLVGSTNRPVTFREVDELIGPAVNAFTDWLKQWDGELVVSQ